MNLVRAILFLLVILASSFFEVSFAALQNPAYQKFPDVQREVVNFVRPGTFYSKSRNCAIRLEEQEPASNETDGLVRVNESLSAEPMLIFTVMQTQPSKELARVVLTPESAMELSKTEMANHQSLVLKGVTAGATAAVPFEVSLLQRKNTRGIIRMNVKVGGNSGYCF